MSTMFIYQNLVLSNFCKKHRFKKSFEMRNLRRGPDKNLLKNPTKTSLFITLFYANAILSVFNIVFIHEPDPVYFVLHLHVIAH